MERKPIYSLQEISEWKEKNIVQLPTVQRGFVWRPYQIENLWDSLLRHYPVGAFVLSPKADNNTFEMLDGQQRATAICLGFGNATFRGTQVKIFIDLEKPRGEDNRKYIFRAITRSHPWGYQRTDNTKTLTAENIRKAMNLYDIDEYLDASLDSFYPYDASLPVPFNLFIDHALKGNNIDQLIKDIYSDQNWIKIKSNWYKKIESSSLSKELGELSTDKNISTRINHIFNAVKKMLDEDTGQKIPALYLDFDQFKKDAQVLNDYELTQSEQEENEEENENASDEIENLFIRLNAGGTPLRGEELNYSILKANISHEFQNLIEKACEGLFKPSRLITILYRLFQHQKKQEGRDGLTMRIKPKQFQKTIGEGITDFEKFINQFIQNKGYSGKTILEYVKYILEYDEHTNPYGLPYLISSKIADVAPEVMFLLLYRLIFWRDTFEHDTDVHRKALGIITLFMWLGKGEKQRDHAKLLSNVWPCAKTLKQELFWSASTVQRASLNEILTPFPLYDKGRKKLTELLKYNPQIKSNIRDKYNADTKYGLFVDKMFYNKDLILYNQRVFLSNYFKQKQYHLDDTNIPFDWDHISPNKFVYKQFGIPQIIKDWYNSNGNFRAWPYSLNRMDQDDIPALKLNPLNPEHYSLEESKQLIEIQNKWEYFINKNKHLIKSSDELKDCLSEWSFCNYKWKTCEIRDFKKGWKEVYRLIMERNLLLCKNWYKELLIEDLKPSVNKNELFSHLIDTRKWYFNPTHDKELKDFFKTDDRNSWVSRPIVIEKTNIYLYFIYYKNTEELLKDNSIEFGIFEKDDGNLIRTVKISEKLKTTYNTDKKYWIQGDFTLTSQVEESYIELFKEFREWLRKFPKQEIKELANNFKDSLVIKYRNKL